MIIQSWKLNSNPIARPSPKLSVLCQLLPSRSGSVSKLHSIISPHLVNIMDDRSLFGCPESPHAGNSNQS